MNHCALEHGTDKGGVGPAGGGDWRHISVYFEQNSKISY